MSADRWTECPKCKENKAILKKQIEELYGKIPLDEYRELQRKLNILQNARPETLREDFEQGIIDGAYSVHYEGHCVVCEFTFKYSFEKDVLS